MLKRHIQIRLVKATDEKEAVESTPFPFLEIEEVVQKIFIGIGALILVTTVSKILINKFS